MMDTQYAPAERDADDVIWAQYGKFCASPVLNNFLSKIDQYIIVLNKRRQIIFANASFLADMGVSDVYDALGKRIGELLDCRFAWCVAGCGTSEFCMECGAVRSILESQNGMDNVRECIILTKNSKTLELGVSSKSIHIAGKDYTLFSITDLSERKNLKAIEDIFFHDISNLATSMHSMIHLLHDERILDKQKIQAQLVRSSEELLSELNSHKLLKSAEKNELVVDMGTYSSITVMERAIGLVERLQSSRGNILYIHHNSAEFDIKTDINLINRVLINMLTNALEASSFGEKVTIGSEILGENKIFWVHNSSYMSPAIQAKIFRTNFSTKKRGSGYGTSSIRLITENYLGGRVSFSSDKDNGTVFRIILK
jgi:signal transduction histidine kinase